MIEFFTRMLAQVAVPEASAKAVSYYHSGNFLWIFQWIWTLGLPLLFLVTGFSGKLGAFSKKYGKNWFLSILVYLALFVGLYQLLNLPVDFYANYIREHEYGLSTQTLGRWLDNYGKMTLVLFLGAAAFTWIFYLLLRKSLRRWWFYSSLVSVGIAFIMTFAYPIWIDPLFNEIGPLKDKQLEKSILDLAARAGIEDGRVFEVDKSKDTTMGNAYVAGLGSTKRIVLWDTSIKANSREGILFIMGHEMGHYVLHHAWWWLAWFSFSAFAILYLIYKTTNFLLPRYQKRLGFQHLYDIASFPLLLFLVNFFIFLATPIFNYGSRYFEREADRFGIEITRNNEVAAKLFADAVDEHLANPRPGIIYKIWRSHHPSIGDRVDFCNSYCPWQEGKEMKYSNHFKTSENILLLVRHGQTDWNIDDRAQGHTNNPLNEKGVAQAEKLAEKIASSYPDITAIYSSDLDRAFVTAQITGERLHLQVEKRQQLRERNNGAVEGLTLEEERVLYGASEEALTQLYPHHQERWNYTSIPGAETYNELLQRAKNELAEIATKHPGENVAVFAHGEIFGIFISDLLGKEKPMHLPNCSIIKVVYSPEDQEHPFKFIAIDE